MRILVILISLTAFLSVNGQSIIIRNSQEKPFVGVWEMVSAINPLTNGLRMKADIGNLKVFGADGTYLFLQLTPVGTMIAQQGHFTVSSDSVYVEHVEKAINQGLNGVSSTVKYTFDPLKNVLKIQGVVNGFAFDEEWRKVSLPVIVGNQQQKFIQL